jgi:fatty-acyl-CoA synthase
VLPVALGLVSSLPIVLHRPAALAVPLFHGHGLATLAMALACAAPLHVARKPEIAPLLARGSFSIPPIVVSVPTLLARWLAVGPVAVPIAAVVSGSAPLSPSLCRGILDCVGPVLYNLYGSSEAGIVSLATPAMLQAAPGTVGAPLPGNQIRLLDSQDIAVTTGRVGRICVHGPLIVGATCGGWLDTGDLGSFDDLGRLHVCGRADGMFVSGGENVYPQEVEAHMREHPAIADAAIAVVSDAEFGHRMRAFVVLREDENATAREIGTWLKQRLERCKQPKSIELVADLPRNLLGKIDRVKLQRLAEAVTTT